MKWMKKDISISAMMMSLVMGVALVTLVGALLVFIKVYEGSVLQNAVTSSEQAVAQVCSTVENYVSDMEEVMVLTEQAFGRDLAERQTSLDALMEIRSDVVAISCYDEQGTMLEAWAGMRSIKDPIYKNLSFDMILEAYGDEDILVSRPHVESLVENYYPWVVSMGRQIQTGEGMSKWIVMDIRFSRIADYVDNVGIGPHGYCFLIDQEGNIVYHPQQQLIFSGLKQEKTALLMGIEDGSVMDQQVIYTAKSLQNSQWKVVGVSYIDEVVNENVSHVIEIVAMLLLLVFLLAILCSFLLSRSISQPIRKLVKAMGEFEEYATTFSFEPIHGSREILSLSDSFGHMVIQIQELMERVRREELSLRKTELKALQAQINPHFLYNTLDAIGWLCEEERNQDAVEMVNALARLFRISISKGHELITIEKELEHAKSYLKIQNFRYKNQFTYSFVVDESCLPYYCNKITLQPIIENAIYHGLNRMVDEGEIAITVCQEGEDIVFKVTDNGVGMSEEQCQEILGKEAGDRTGIGIKNVNDRIKIYFGEKYGVSIESELDAGTCVIIRMPKVREGEQL